MRPERKADSSEQKKEMNPKTKLNKTVELGHVIMAMV